MNPWLGMLLIAGTLAALIAGLRVIQKRFKPHPEVIRKSLHVIMGLVTLSLPWIFDVVWPVLLLSIVTVMALLIIKTSKLKNNVGQVLHGVSRDSLGDLYFTASTALVFSFALPNWILFVIPLLILTLADATAALVGLRYGKSNYGTLEAKSIEGSVAFFIITFLSVHLTLLLATDTGRVESVLIGIMLGTLVMMLEAVAWQGLDNLFIPLGTFLLLNVYLQLDVADLLLHFSIVLILIIFTSVWRQRTAMDVSAVMSTALVGYVIWATAGWLWMLAPFLLFISYARVLPQELKSRSIHTVHAVLNAIAPGFIWLFFAQGFGESALLFPYTLSFAAYLAIVGMARIRHDDNSRHHIAIAVQSALYGWILMFLPMIILAGFSPSAWLQTAIALIAVAGASWIFFYIQPGFKQGFSETTRWLWQSGIAAGASCLGLLILLW